jgi:heat shock protein 1/8
MNTKLNGPFVGIDIGNTYSCVATLYGSSIDIIPNDKGCRTTPSYIAFNQNGSLVGEDAKKQYMDNYKNTIFNIKRLIGRKYTYVDLKLDRKLWSFNIESKNDKPIIHVESKGENNHLSTEEVYSLIMSKMKKIAEDYLGKEVKNVVVTVPSYFNKNQRHSTKNACNIIGLNIMSILNENSSAAIAYGMEKNDQNILIFEYGGSTQYTSILHVDDGIFCKVANSSVEYTGGKDFDNRLVLYFSKEFKRKHKKDITNNNRAMRKLLTACEIVKEKLSFSLNANIDIDDLYNGIDFNSTIDRSCFEDLCDDLFIKAVFSVEKVLKYSGLPKHDIKEIILVGGSTRIPKIKQMLSDLFNGKDLCNYFNPEEVVARGAAIHASFLGTLNVNENNILRKNLTIIPDIYNQRINAKIYKQGIHSIINRAGVLCNGLC